MVGKKELVAALADKLGSTKKAAGEAFDAFVETTQEALATGEDVAITGLVSFRQKEVVAHEKTVHFSGKPEVVQVPAKVKISAKASKTLTK